MATTIEGLAAVRATDARGRVVQAGSGYRAEQGSDYRPGISAESVRATALWLGIVTLPAGRRTSAHIHAHHESAFHVLSGEVELWTGDLLQHMEVARAGDYLFIPMNVPHVAVNRGSEPAVFVGARNEPTAQESVIMRPELDARVP